MQKFSKLNKLRQKKNRYKSTQKIEGSNQKQEKNKGKLHAVKSVKKNPHLYLLYIALMSFEFAVTFNAFNRGMSQKE